MNNTKRFSILSKDGVSYLIPFILITSCFALWGFANDITNPMVKAFSKIFRMSVTDGALVQVAFYGGYFAMAFPAAIFIRRYSYKAGILLGLGLYAFGALLFFPAMMTGNYYPFLIAYYIVLLRQNFRSLFTHPLRGKQTGTVLNDKCPTHDLCTHIEKLSNHPFTIMMNGKDTLQRRQKIDGMRLVSIFGHLHHTDQQ